MTSRLLALALAASTLVPIAARGSSSPAVLELGGAEIMLNDAMLAVEDAPGVFTASVDVTEGSAAVAWALAAAQGKGGTRDGSTVIETGKKRRRATFSGASVTEVKLDDLDANNNKKPYQITFKWQAETVEYSKASGKAATKQSKPAPLWTKSSFHVDGLGALEGSLVRVSMPRITIVDGKPVFGDLAFVFEGEDAETLHAKVKKVIKDGAITDEEYSSWGVDLVDPSMPTRKGRISIPRCKLKSTSASIPKSGKATVTAVFMVETFDPAGIVLQHK